MERGKRSLKNLTFSWKVHMWILLLVSLPSLRSSRHLGKINLLSCFFFQEISVIFLDFRMFCDSCVVSFTEMLRRCVECGHSDVTRSEADTTWLWFWQTDAGTWSKYTNSKDIEDASQLGHETFDLSEENANREVKKLYFNCAKFSAILTYKFCCPCILMFSV